MHILIADDHLIIRAGLKQILHAEFPSAVIEEAEDSDSALKKVFSGNWDVIICDLNMPGRSGLEVLHEIKQHFPKLPVLILSMHSEEHYAIRALKAGASGYISKNSAATELVTAIQRVLQGRKYINSFTAEKLATDLLDNSGKQPHELLSDREFEILRLIASGKAVSEIAGTLSLCITTISTYRYRILTKMKMKTNAELTRYALENKLA
jgi:two-component system invasion response regulator UvrY